MREFCGNRNVLCLNSINVNILAVIVHYYFVRCYQWGELGNEYSVLFL